MEQPKSIRFAVITMWLAIGIHIVYDLAEVFKNINKLNFEDFMTYIVLYNFSSILLVVYIAKRRRWAQLLYLFMFIISVAFLIMSEVYLKSMPINYKMAIFIILDVIAIYYLFKKEAIDWFKSLN